MYLSSTSNGGIMASDIHLVFPDIEHGAAVDLN